MQKIWNKIKEFCGENQHALALAAAVIGCLLFGYACGRYAQPAKVVTKEVVKEVVKTQVVEKTKSQDVLDKASTRATDQKVHRVITETKRPDGTETKTTTEDVSTDTASKEVVHDVQIQYVDRTVTQWKTREVKVEVQKLHAPDWHLYAGVGVSVPHFIGQGDVGLPGLGGLVISAGVERRVLGPILMGLAANTQGTVSFTLGGTF